MTPKKVQPVPDVPFPYSLSLDMTGHHQGLGWRHTPMRYSGDTTMLNGLLGQGVWELSPDLRSEGSWQPATAAHPLGLGTGG